MNWFQDIKNFILYHIGFEIDIKRIKTELNEVLVGMTELVEAVQSDFEKEKSDFEKQILIGNFIENYCYIENGDCFEYEAELVQLFVSQAEIIFHFVINKWTLFFTRRQCGSTTILQILALYHLVHEKNFRILYLTQNYEHARTCFYGFGKLHDDMNEDYHLDMEIINYFEILFGNDNFIKFESLNRFTSSNIGNIKSNYLSDYNLIMIDTDGLHTEPVQNFINSLNIEHNKKVVICSNMYDSYPIFVENLKHFETITIK